MFKKSVSLGTSLAVQWLSSLHPLEGARVQSLVGELRSHMPWGVAKKRKKNLFALKIQDLLYPNQQAQESRWGNWDPERSNIQMELHFGMRYFWQLSCNRDPGTILYS